MRLDPSESPAADSAVSITRSLTHAPLIRRIRQNAPLREFNRHSKPRNIKSVASTGCVTKCSNLGLLIFKHTNQNKLVRSNTSVYFYLDNMTTQNSHLKKDKITTPVLQQRTCLVSLYYRLWVGFTLTPGVKLRGSAPSFVLYEQCVDLSSSILL